MPETNLDLTKYIDMAVPYVINFATALVVLIIGSWIIKVVMKNVEKFMKKQDLDSALQPFLCSLLKFTLKALLFISVLGMLGIEMTSFIAILGAAGLAVGMALSGTLQNFAGGVMILIFKPFKIGDVIDAQGYVGSVLKIEIFNTILKTPDNKHIIIPNGGLSTSSMVNFSVEETRRVDWTVGIGYGDSTEKAREVIGKLISDDKRILQDPAPFVAVSELGDSSVNFTVRAWVNSADYWGVYFDMNEKVYNTFDKEGLNIPYPQMDVHVHKD